MSIVSHSLSCYQISNKICVQLNKEEGTIDLKFGRLVDCFPASDILFWVHSLVSLFILGRPIPWSHCGRNCQDWEVRDQLLSVTTKEHLRFLLLAMSRRWPNFLSTCDFLGSCGVGGTRIRKSRMKVFQTRLFLLSRNLKIKVDNCCGSSCANSK